MAERKQTAREQADQLHRQADAGEYLRDIREKKGITLTQLSEKIGVSAAYLSGLERGFKMPSDKLIMELADFYKLDTEDLFNRFGKVSATATTVLEKNPGIQKTLATISRDPRIPEDKKQAMYDEFFNVYLTYLREIGEEPYDHRRGSDDD
ncbi:helix-turn-helix domain-containing protein [Heliobacillus mobilis]|uniref:Helix-turn-helix domain-containing protein n=1 Tax=Heliobacterium mobile TaxID=28064 RepID=A0A6I3SLL8_HELMO|nr:helix-turn-helix transcriptional regulator [Heliobacterium mobile]MTV49824.1 helix-turn-helix domain-containing protein [Heliobacterium mobile]